MLAEIFAAGNKKHCGLPRPSVDLCRDSEEHKTSELCSPEHL